MKTKLLGLLGYACIYATLAGLIIRDRIPKPAPSGK